MARPAFSEPYMMESLTTSRPTISRLTKEISCRGIIGPASRLAFQVENRVIPAARSVVRWG